MNCSVLTKSALFSGLSAPELTAALESTPHHIHNYEKGEIIFRLMEPASRIGVILEGRVEAQKSFPNGSQINVSVRGPGEMIGPAAVFARNRTYPCDIVSLEPVTVMMFHRDDLLGLMQSDLRILVTGRPLGLFVRMPVCFSHFSVLRYFHRQLPDL